MINAIFKGLAPESVFFTTSLHYLPSPIPVTYCLGTAVWAVAHVLCHYVDAQCTPSKAIRKL